MKRLPSFFLLVGIILSFSACSTSSDNISGELTVEAILADPTGQTVTVDHSDYDTLLQKYVDTKGMVNYRDWKADDEEMLKQYISKLEEVDPRKLTREEKLAYFLNAYNAVTIAGVLERYPLKSVHIGTDPEDFSTILDDASLSILGTEFSLDGIKNDILRKMSDPRVHFSLSCAAVSCSPLSSKAFTGNEIEVQLLARTVKFFAHIRNFQIIKRLETVYLSRILKWFAEDFGADERAILEYVKPYLILQTEKDFLTDHPNLTIKYLDYDWSLNEQMYKDE